MKIDRRKTVGRPRKNSNGGNNFESEPITTEQAAKRAGFANRGTAYRVRTVIEKGIPELVEAMDPNKIPVSAAAR